MESDKKRLGELLVEDGHLTSDQVDAVLEKQKTRPGVPFGQVCVELGYLNRSQLDYLLLRYGKRLALGQILLNSNIVNQDQLQSAYEVQRTEGGRLGEILVKLGFIGEVELCETLARQFNIPCVPLDHLRPPKELRALVNPTYAARNRIVPIALLGERLTLAISDPTQDGYLDDLRGMTGLSIDPVLASPSDISFLYERLYGRPITDELNQGRRPKTSPEVEAPSVESTPEERPTGPSGLPWESAPGDNPADEAEEWSSGAVDEDAADELPEGTEADALGGDPDLEILEEEVDVIRSHYTMSLEDSPVARTVVQTLLARALSQAASDIHLEIFATGPRLRLRIDGILRDCRLGSLEPLFRKNYRSVISRLKVLASMDIAERRRPQGGSFRMLTRRMGQLASVDFRLSTLPGRFGEGMVIRVLDQLQAPRSLDSLGLSSAILDPFRSLIRQPTGIILITGPTGSGKSSTLFAALRTLYRPEIKIVTAEDPIEYTVPGVFQAEVNTAIGNTFGTYLRSFLRQDPDVIMIGEIRDSETAEMALRAAQTGHLLLSTLHTNNATASVHRLYDLCHDANSLASNVIGVMAQRLVRRICPECVEPYRPEEEVVREWFGDITWNRSWIHGRGCEECGGTGYAGRVAVAELWVPTAEEVALIGKQVPPEELRRAFLSRAPSMAEDALRKALEGITTPEEALRVVPYEDVVRLRQKGAAPLGPAKASVDPLGRDDTENERAAA